MIDKLSAIIFNTRELLKRLENVKEKMKVYQLSSKELSGSNEDLEFRIIRCEKAFITFHNNVKKIESIVREIEEKIQS
jgi:hypothetical protein